jgi:hypothetical protein
VSDTVKVTGTWDKAADKSEAAAGSHDPSAAQAGEPKAKEHHFKVDKIDMVSDTCTKAAAKK